jgi:D-alanyl-D-alanine carboxypeptidase
MLAAQLQAIADRDVQTWPAMPARLLHVLAPSRGIDVEVAAGVADRASGVPLTPGARFRIASVTKTFVGAAALRLVEQGQVGLDDPLDSLVSVETLEVLRGGDYDTGVIALRHLMSHTSGLYDFAASAYDPSITDGFDQAISADPTHRWTRLEQFRFAVDHGKPYGAPGEVYGYSDTNANLVGEMLELRAGADLGAAIRSLVDYQQLGLQHTYLESIEPEPADLPPPSHQYERDVDVVGIDPSVDLYGGGGLVSTCRDLGRFFRGLFQGEVFERPETLSIMTTRSIGVSRAPEVSLADDPDDAALFVFRAEIGGREWWGHDGWWGTTAYTCPELDVTVVAGHQQAYMPKGFDRMSVIAEVQEVLLAADD